MNELNLAPQLERLIRKYDEGREKLFFSGKFYGPGGEMVPMFGPDKDSVPQELLNNFGLDAPQVKTERHDMLQELLLEAYERNSPSPRKSILNALKDMPVMWNSEYQKGVLSESEEHELFHPDYYQMLVDYLYRELIQLCGDWDRYSHAPLSVIQAGLALIQPGRNLCYFPSVNPEVWIDAQLQRAAIASDEYYRDFWAYTRIYQEVFGTPHISFDMAYEHDVLARVTHNEEMLLFEFIVLDWKDQRGNWIVSDDMLLAFYRKLDKDGRMVMLVPTEFFKQDSWKNIRAKLWHDQTVKQVLSLPTHVRWNDDKLQWHILMIENRKQEEIEYLDASYFNYNTHSAEFDLYAFLNLAQIQDSECRQLHYRFRYDKISTRFKAMPLLRVGEMWPKDAIDLSEVVKPLDKHGIMPQERRGKLLNADMLSAEGIPTCIDEKTVGTLPLYYMEYHPIDEPCVILCMNDGGISVGYIEHVSERIWAPLYALVLVPNGKMPLEELARKCMTKAVRNQLMTMHLPMFGHMGRLTSIDDVYLPVNDDHQQTFFVHE